MGAGEAIWRPAVWAVRPLLSRRQWPMLAAIAMLAIAVIAGLAAWARHSELDRLRRQLIEAQQRRNEQLASGPLQPARVALSRLPPHESVHEQLREIYQAADRTQVRIAMAEYRTLVDAQANLVVVNVAMTITDEYLPIQRALIEVLRSLPNAGLESAAFRRPDRRSSRVEARLNLVLHFRAGSAIR